jgi:hypothetical protein
MEKEYKLALMNPHQFAELIGIIDEANREKYIDNLVPELGRAYIETYDIIKLYITTDNYNYKSITGREFIQIWERTDFKKAFRKISDIQNFSNFLDEMFMHDDEIFLWMLVFSKMEELEFELDDLLLIENLGGTREAAIPENSHTPILKSVEIPKGDPLCNGRTILNGYCTLLYDATLIKNSYQELLESGNYLEFYVKGSQLTNNESLILRGKYCFLNKVADHLHDPNIKRFFVEEGGRISPYRINAREADFRRTIVKNLRGFHYKNSCIDELLIKLASNSENSIDIYKKEVHEFYDYEINQIQKYKKKATTIFYEIEATEKKILQKENIEKHLKLLKLLDASYGVSEFWIAMYDKTDNQALKSEMDTQGGKDLNNVFNQSLYNEIGNYNLLNERLNITLSIYFNTKKRLIKILQKRIELFDDFSLDKLKNVFISNELLFDDVSLNDIQFKGISNSYNFSIKSMKTFDDIAKSVTAYNELDRNYITDIRASRSKDVQEAIEKINEETFSNLEFEKNSNNKGWGITIRMNPIKFPKPSDIGRELGGVIDAAGNVINQAGSVVVNVIDEVVDKGEELFSNLDTNISHFLNEELPEFEKYIRRDFGTDLDTAFNNIILKPINFIFCGGKQPPDEPSEDDGCIEGGLECTNGPDGTDCRLTDSQGNPSEIPNTDDISITEEQLQWMHDMEVQDTLNSDDFAESMSSWFLDVNDANAIQRMLTIRQDLLNEQISDIDNANEFELAFEITTQKSIIGLIVIGIDAAVTNVVTTFKDLFNIAKTIDELKATINFVAENGTWALGSAIADSLVTYWEEFKTSNSIGKSEIIGNIASDVIISLIPVGAIAKFGKETVRVSAASSRTINLVRNISDNAIENLSSISSPRLGNMIGDLKQAVSTRGNFDFTPGSTKQAYFIGDCWVGPNPTKSAYSNHPGKYVFISRDQTKRWREPVSKGDSIKANYEWRTDRNSPWPNQENPTINGGNSHMEIID